MLWYVNTFKGTSLVRFCTLTKEFSNIRAEFWHQEKVRESKVDLNKFSEAERAIYRAHKEAIENGYFTYQDPFTKEKIWTTYKHFLTGKCCGEGCRHCIFNHGSVPNELSSKKVFNGSFWVDIPGENSNYFKDLFNIIKVK